MCYSTDGRLNVIIGQARIKVVAMRWHMWIHIHKIPTLNIVGKSEAKGGRPWLGWIRKHFDRFRRQWRPLLKRSFCSPRALATSSRSTVVSVLTRTNLLPSNINHHTMLEWKGDPGKDGQDRVDRHNANEPACRFRNKLCHQNSAESALPTPVLDVFLLRPTTLFSGSF